jgi:hypothetical protein
MQPASAGMHGREGAGAMACAHAAWPARLPARGAARGACAADARGVTSKFVDLRTLNNFYKGSTDFFLSEFCINCFQTLNAT